MAPVALIEFAVPAIADLVEISITAAHQWEPTERNLYDFSASGSSGI